MIAKLKLLKIIQNENVYLDLKLRRVQNVYSRYEKVKIKFVLLNFKFNEITFTIIVSYRLFCHPIKAESDATLNHWVSVIEDTLHHHLQPPHSNTSNQKSSTQYHFSHFPIGSATASPNAFSNRTVEKDDNETNHFALNEDIEDTHKKNSSAPASGKIDRKLTIGTRNRSPTGSSPKEKSRKASAGEIFSMY